MKCFLRGGGGGGHRLVSLGMVHTSHGACTPEIGSKNASHVGSNAFNEWLQTDDHSWVQCPHRSVGANTSNVGGNAPDGRRMIGPVADNVGSKVGRMPVTKGWHGAKSFGAKKILCCAFEQHVQERWKHIEENVAFGPLRAMHGAGQLARG